MMNEQYLYEKAKEHKGKDFLQIATAFNHTIRIYVTKTTDVILDAQKVHELYPTAVAALGRSLTATLIMGSMLKGKQSIAVKIDGGGPNEKKLTGKLELQVFSNGSEDSKGFEEVLARFEEENPDLEAYVFLCDHGNHFRKSSTTAWLQTNKVR